MGNARLTEQMQAYGRWKSELIEAIQRYRQWLEATRLGEAEQELRIFETVEAVKSDRLTVAFVAEFARGKTELINAIFFSEYDRRLLPSEAGRTTMCPTELFYDNEADEAYVRLLPIESRLEESSIAELRNNRSYWSHIPLHTDDPQSMAEAFREIVRVKHVSAEEAEALGLCDVEGNKPEGDRVEIPVWRHALISFPHPLLRQGLVILDTPGLNALGSEPELTLNMLPSAQAVVFVLGADSGVTKSDMEMWQQNVRPSRNGGGQGLMVVLNKIDVLWDELKSEEEIHRIIEEQRHRAAETLDVEVDRVYPASAQKGLLAKIRHDTPLLERSNILTLEHVLGSEVLPRKEELLREAVAGGVGAMVQESCNLIMERLGAAKRQLDELRGLSGKNNEVIEHLMQKTREEQAAYYKNVESFQANRKILTEQSARLSEFLNVSAFDQLVQETRRSMAGSWTTHGLKAGMKTFFDGVRTRLDELQEQSEQVNRLAVTIYRKFHQEHGLTEIEPALFQTAGYIHDFDLLYREAEAFRNSPLTAMTEQSMVIKKFFISLVSHARNIFYKAHKESERWGKAVMSPLVRQIKDHKAQMEQRLENLRKINDSRDTLQTRIDELERISRVLARQYAEVKPVLEMIQRPLANDVMPPAAAAAGGG